MVSGVWGGRVEGEPELSKGKKKPMTPEQIRLLAAERRAKERAADARMEWGVSADTMTLAAERGDEITQFPIRPGEREKPLKRLSGLDWLWNKGRIDTTQMAAGLKYGDQYRIASDVSVRSAMNFSRAGGDGSTSQEIRKEAQENVAAARGRGLNGHPTLIALMDAIAGEGMRVRDYSGSDDALAAKNEANLLIALDHLATFYGMK